jgi:hypothetical protein
MGLFDDKKEQAVRPNSFFAIPSFVKNEVAEQKGITDEERVLGTGAHTEFWQVFNARANQVMTELEQMNDSAIASGASFDEIGRNTIVINLTKGVLTRLFNSVNDAREALEQAVNEQPK